MPVSPTPHASQNTSNQPSDTTSQAMKIHIQGGRLIDPASNTDAAQDLYIAAGKIVGVGSAPADFTANKVIDARGLIVCPGLVESGEPPWWEVVAAAGEAGHGTVVAGRELQGWDLVFALKQRPDAERRAALDLLRPHGLPVLARWWVPLDTEELDRWLDAGFGLGNHTWDHPCLDQCTAAEQRDQIERADRWLRARVEGWHPSILAHGTDSRDRGGLSGRTTGADYRGGRWIFGTAGSPRSGIGTGRGPCGRTCGIGTGGRPCGLACGIGTGRAVSGRYGGATCRSTSGAGVCAWAATLGLS